MDASRDCIYGCLIGVFVGDAVGASLEFVRHDITPNVANRAMRMEGGGVLNIAPGQFTDDSELAVHLLRALCDKDPKQGMPLLEIAQQYIQWHQSNPFDCGMTCGRAFAFSTNEKDMMEKAMKYSLQSQANGSLMRIAPLAIWCRNMPAAVIFEYARTEATLSHPNIVCQDANVMYCLALKHLINNPGDADGAIKYCMKFIHLFDPTVATWFNISLSCDINDIVCTTNIGHVKHAFMLAFHLLNKKVTFEEGIHITLMKGGDTDTNAAIVGGMLGALHGFSRIPKYMKDPVLQFDPSTYDPQVSLLGYRRPQIYSANHAIQCLDYMLNNKVQ